MPVLLDRGTSGHAVLGCQREILASDFAPSRSIDVALVNNMPDSALEGTERQFAELLTAAAGDMLVRLKLFSLPGVPRAETARRYLGETYSAIDSLWNSRPDGADRHGNGAARGGADGRAVLEGAVADRGLGAICDRIDHLVLSRRARRRPSHRRHKPAPPARKALRRVRMHQHVRPPDGQRNAASVLHSSFPLQRSGPERTDRLRIHRPIALAASRGR